MSIFSWNKKDEGKLDEALTQPTPKPEVLYTTVVITETESVPSPPMSLAAARLNAEWMASHGAYVMLGNEPSKHIPPHRIFEILFKKVEG
jgi:hypothetical protein